MNYGVQSQVDVAEKPRALDGIRTRFADRINESHALMNEIESKVHDILNLRTPKNEATGEKPQIPMNDLTTQLNNEVERLQWLNERLEKLRIHLNQII